MMRVPWPNSFVRSEPHRKWVVFRVHQRNPKGHISKFKFAKRKKLDYLLAIHIHFRSLYGFLFLVFLPFKRGKAGQNMHQQLGIVLAEAVERGEGDVGVYIAADRRAHATLSLAQSTPTTVLSTTLDRRSAY